MRKIEIVIKGTTKEIAEILQQLGTQMQANNVNIDYIAEELVKKMKEAI